MSDLINPTMNGMTERQFKRQGQMNVTHDELAEQLKVFAKAILGAFGPIGAMQVELMQRQQALEDHLGFVYVPKATVEAPVVASESPETRESIATQPKDGASEATP